MVDPERTAEYHAVVGSVAEWGERRPDIMGIAVVGSWARDEPRMESDLDLVVLTVDRSAYVDQTAWIAPCLGVPATLTRTAAWGPLTERRVRLRSGFEIEFGFASPHWARTAPLDEGTANVVRGGCRPILDPTGVFARLIAAVHAA